MRLGAVVCLGLSLAACERSYLVPRTAADRVAEMPPDERQRTAVPAQSDHGPVFVRASGVVLERVSPASDVRMVGARAGGMRPLTSVGIAVAVAGAVVTAIGGAVWVHGDRACAAGCAVDVVAGTGQIMVGVAGGTALVGSILAVVGATRGGTVEVAAGRPDLRYLDAPTRAGLAPPVAPGPTVRFSF